MSVDFQVCFPQEILPLTGVRTIDGLSVRTVDVRAADLRGADEVLINGVPAPEFVLLSDTRLLAQVPDAVLSSPISSVQVTSSRLVLSPQSRIRFRLGNTTSKVRGILRLVQLFLKILLTSQGSDIFARKIGASALRNLGDTFSAAESGRVVSDLVLSVANAQRQLIAIQARDTSIPADERLLAAKVTRAAYDRNESALVATIELTSQTGRVGLANLAL